MKALVCNGKVVQIEEESFEVATPLQWVEIPAEDIVTCGDLYADGVFSLPPGETLSPSEVVNKINAAVNEYIYSRYDSGTQSSFVALYVGPQSTAEIKAAIESVWDWTKTVLTHYYTAKALILAEQEYEWDLSQFDETDPQVSLASLLEE